LTRKNPSPYDLYCVGGTLNPTQSLNHFLDSATTIILFGCTPWMMSSGDAIELFTSTVSRSSCDVSAIIAIS